MRLPGTLPRILAVAALAGSAWPPVADAATLRAVRIRHELTVSRVVLDLSAAASYVFEQGDDQVSVRLEGVNAPTTSIDYPTNDPLVAGVEVTDEGESVAARVRFAAKPGRIRHYALSNPDRVVVDLYPAAGLPDRGREGPVATDAIGGDDLLSLNFKAVDIADVLRTLSRTRGYNLVMGPRVNGPVTVSLTKVSLREALDAVIRVTGYTYSIHDNTIYVLHPKARKDLDGDLFGLEQSALVLNYLDPKEAYKIALPYLSTVGSAVASERTRRLIVEDRPDIVQRIRNLLDSVDRRPRQIFIESAIMEVTVSQNQEFNVDLNYVDAGDRAKQIFGDDAGASLLTKGFAQSAAGTLPGAFFAFSNNNIEILVNALQSKGNTKTLATPKVLALDGESAEIIIGERFGYRDTKTVTEAAATETVTFLEVGTQLRLQPKIYDDGYIRMNIHPEVSSGSVDAVSGLPQEKTTEVSTTLVLRDGETLIIGGLLRESTGHNEDQVPYLGDIPILGWFFQGWKEDNNKTEIVVMVTPHIVKDGIGDWARNEVETAEKIKSATGNAAYQ
ncbi:MAG: hypothetical protein KC466_14465 [Myxococcales bacterium]|nr:hypothetical protein [Myxococcales bacterium]